MASSEGQGSDYWDDDALLCPPPDLEVKVYRRRWYVLLVYSAVSFFQAVVWNTWTPLDLMVKLSYNWTNITLATLSNWSTFVYLVLFWPFCFLLEKKGLKDVIVWSAFLVFISTAIRCIPIRWNFFQWLAHTGAILNGVAGVIMWFVPTALSALWFPPHQRTTATGLASMAPQLGVAGGYISAYFIKWPYNAANHSHNHHHPHHNMLDNSTEIDTVRERIVKFMYVEAVVGLFILICIITYFPAKPLNPPSVTSSYQRLKLRDGLKLLQSKKDFWLLLISCSISQGFPNAWTGLMALTLEPLGISQENAGLIGAWAIVTSCIGMVLVTRFNDVLNGHLKLSLSLLMIGTCVCYVWLALICLRVIPFSEVQLYAAVILGATFNFAAYPLFLEGAVEVAYPVSEAIVGGCVGFGCNIIAGLFYFIFFIPNIGYLWMNYALIASTSVILPVLFVMKVTYNRLQMDNEVLC